MRIISQNFSQDRSYSFRPFQKVYSATYSTVDFKELFTKFYSVWKAMGNYLLDLVFLLVYTAFTNGGVELYITPSVDSSCPQDPCITLLHFADDPSNYAENETNINHR